MKFILRKIALISFIIIFSPNAYSNPSDKLYEKLDLFSDVLNTLKKEYVDEVEQSEVIDAAINGMLQSLDPYSGYMSPESFRNMNDDTRGEFGGLGIEIWERYLSPWPARQWCFPPRTLPSAQKVRDRPPPWAG